MAASLNGINGVGEAPSTNGVDSKPPQHPVLLLIGSTGSGKSTLGNFLLNPSHEHIFKGSKQTFKTAKANVPMTDCVKSACDNVDKPTIQVVDTPGLNEGVSEDLLHMSDIVKALRELQHVSACILCVRFNATIDAQWKATIAYYRRLLPVLFEGNVVIVMTDYQTDDRSVQRRELEEIDVNEVTRNVVKAAKECGKILYNPQVFHIESKPMDKNDRPRSEKDRDAILSYIQKSLTPVAVANLKVAKTEALKHRDYEEKVRLEEEIAKMTESLKQMKEQANDVIDQTESGRMLMTKFELENLVPLSAELEELDTQELMIVDTCTWKVEETWKFLRSRSETFDIKSPWPIREKASWDNGHLKWTFDEHEEEKNRVSGKVEGQFMRGLYASLTIKTYKQDIHAERIGELRAKIAENEGLLERMSSDQKKVHENYAKSTEKHMDERIACIAEMREKQKLLTVDFLTLEEADDRLKEISAQTKTLP